MQRSPEAENNSNLSAQTAIPPERGVLESFLHRERLRPVSDLCVQLHASWPGGERGKEKEIDLCESVRKTRRTTYGVFFFCFFGFCVCLPMCILVIAWFFFSSSSSSSFPSLLTTDAGAHF